MFTILEESDKDFKKIGSFRTMVWMSSNNPSNKLVRTFWQIETNLKKFNFIEMMKMEYFLYGLDPVRMRCLFDAPNVLTDQLFLDALKAKEILGLSPILMERLNILQTIEEKKIWSENLFFTINKILKFRIRENRSAIRSTAKFSGYVRNISAIGTKKALPIRPDPETSEWSDIVHIDFLRFLTVGELTTGTPGGNALVLTMTSVKSKRFLTNL
jgi:hypothetical protein